jgi:subtilase family serine protease
MVYQPLVLLLFYFTAVSCAIAGAHVARPHIRVQGPFTKEALRARTIHRTRSSNNYLQPFNPSTELCAIYNVPCTTNTSLGAGKTIALVDAYGSSSAESDLIAFSQEFGLPAITATNFQKVNQTGGTTYPADTNTSWATEVALDLQSAHMFAPGAKLLLVVCNSNSFSDLLQGLSYAIAHANYVSMSWGGAEAADMLPYDSYFTGNSVSFFASTGDDGSAGGIEYPSSSQYVVAVGGTSLNTTSTFGLVAETGWSGSGGGCSAYSNASAAQKSNSVYASLGCNAKKAVPDTSMNANLDSGIVIFMSQSNICTESPPCLWIAGGTSLAAPLTAARAAIRGVQVTPTYMYTSTIEYRDVTSGSNGAYSCHVGLDLVTGRGTWIGAN